jgi:hypothetical protein
MLRSLGAGVVLLALAGCASAGSAKASATAQSADDFDWVGRNGGQALLGGHYWGSHQFDRQSG